jgi:hypothetical protein
MGKTGSVYYLVTGRLDQVPTDSLERSVPAERYGEPFSFDRVSGRVPFV